MQNIVKSSTCYTLTLMIRLNFAHWILKGNTNRLLLQDNVVLVDTPGVGVSKEQNEPLLSYIPHAVAFVFVVNVANAGGFQRGRLLDVFKYIKEKLEEMPCFDPKDVLFLMNKWDRIEEHERDEIIRNATNILLEEWCFVSMAPRNTFHVSLKEIKGEEDSTNSFRVELDRFKETLDKMIAKNSNKRLKAHSRYLEGLLFDAKCSIVAAMNYEQWKCEAKSLLDEVNTELELGNQKTNEFSMLLNEEAEKLARKCKAYMSSEVLKREIVKSVTAKGSSNPKQTLYDEFINQLELWCKSEDVASTVTEIDLKIGQLSKKSQEELKSFLDRITGLSTEFPDAPFDFKGIVDKFMRDFPKAVSFHVIAKVLWYFSTTSRKEEKLRSILDVMLEKCSQEILVRSFKRIFTLYFIPKIDYLIRANLKRYDVVHTTLEQFGVVSEMSDEERGKMNTIFDDLKKVSIELSKLQSRCTAL
ncbi:uncharacterized protein LOC130049148 isoform X2 [Ostrea edulis]|uniref:uncharacterized protein LOC130049148 isoform X2 n=1 Tax=Ostrea edulis TaxID=37623 RepID=UPI0024AEE86E|nr:uncharacterized protein LOC130049148 isoform X2 [Ostrea edulis]